MSLFNVRATSAPVQLLLIILLVVSAASHVAAQSMQVLDEIVALVDEHIILRSDVDAMLFQIAQQQRVEPTEEMWEEILERLIDQKVMLAHAQRDTTLAVDEVQIEQSLDEWVNSLVAQVGGERQLEELTGKSVIEFKNDNRLQMREQMLVDEFRRRRMSRIRVTPSEVREWFERIPSDSLPMIPEMVRVAHIVRFPDADPLARQEAFDITTALRDSVVAGSSFEDLARRYSDDPGTASRGGRIEDINISDLVPEFGAVAANMQPGQISQVFETTFGLHVMRLNNRTGDLIDFNHILIRIDHSNTDPTGAIETLTTLRDSILTHEMPFEVIARRHSQDPQSAMTGGHVTSPSGERDVPVEALGDDWQRTLTGLDVGDISMPAPVEVLDGRRVYHIVKLRKRIPEHRMSLATDYARIEQWALAEKRALVTENWIGQLRDRVYISRLVENGGITSVR